MTGLISAAHRSGHRRPTPEGERVSKANRESREPHRKVAEGVATARLIPEPIEAAMLSPQSRTAWRAVAGFQVPIRGRICVSSEGASLSSTAGRPGTCAPTARIVCDGRLWRFQSGLGNFPASAKSVKVIRVT